MAGLRRALVALAAALALADASIVALALPPILVEFNTSITGVAAIVGVYALVLALAILPARRLPPGPWALVLFALASVGCAVSGTLWVLLVFRALQAAGAAAALLTAFAVLEAGTSRAGRRWWLGAALIGTAAGPAIGGLLTQAFDWRAIFAVQAPLAFAAAVATFGQRRAEARAGDAAVGRGVARGGDAAVGPAAAGASSSLLGGGPSAARPPAASLPAADESRAAGRGSAGEALSAADAHPSEAAPSAGEKSRPAPPPARARLFGRDVSSAEPARPAADARPSEPAGPAGDARPSDVAWPAAGADALVPTAASPSADLAALALTAAAFTAVLFLLVIELVAGFAISPLRAAAGVSVLPLAALAAAAIPGEPRSRALAGALLLAGGAGALAFLPAPGIGWTLVPQVLAGAGMGLALPALSHERSVGDAAHSLVARHVGIVVVLAILAPVATARLTTATDHAILQGAALVLDAQIDPLQKLKLAPGLLADIDTGRPRGSLADAVEARRKDFAAEAPVYNRLASRLDDVLVGAVQDAFKIAYLIAAALALLGGAVLYAAWRRPAIILAAALAAGCVVVYAVQERTEAPAPVTLQDPCQERDLPNSGGLTGVIQQQALKQLDAAACKLGVSREEFALAIFDPKRAEAFKADHGVDPRSTIGLLSLLGG